MKLKGLSNESISRIAKIVVEKVAAPRRPKARPTSLDEKQVITSLVKHFGQNMDREERRGLKEEITDSLDLDNEITGKFTADGDDYIIFLNEDEAETEAVRRVTNDVQDIPDMFSPDFLQSYIYISDTDKRVMIADESDSISQDFGFDDEDKEESEREVESRIESFRQSLEDPIQYFVHDQALYTIKELMRQPWIRIDVETVAQDAVNADGWAHFMSNVDGDYETTDEGYVIYKD